MGTPNLPLTMVDSVLVEEIWSSSNIAPTYQAEMRRICLPTDTAVKTSSSSLAQLPHLFCELHGGTALLVIPVITAWTLLRYAARILDDAEDNLSHSTQNGNTHLLNGSTGLIFTAGMALNFLEEYGVPHASATAIRRRFYGELLKTCGGQHLDLTVFAPSIEEWWDIAGAKSGAFLGLICWAGGCVAGALHEQRELYYQFGYKLGLLDQIRDDLTDLWADDTQHSDLHKLHNPGLPAAYALAVLPTIERQQLITHLDAVHHSAESEQIAHDLIVKSGAGVYLSVQSVYLYQQGLELVAQMNLPEKVAQQLIAILNKARLPVNI